MAMDDNINIVLNEYYLLTDNSLQLDNQKNVQGLWELNSYLRDDDYWKLFFDAEFDGMKLCEQFGLKSEEERSDYLKFAIDCFITFVQCNFTGPEVSEEVEELLGREMFGTIDFGKILSVNNEDINVNTEFPVLLVVAKIVFKCCVVRDIVNNWWYWRSIYIHQQVLDELSPVLLSEADLLYKQFKVLPFTGVIKASLDVEIAQMYVIYHHISKSKEHIFFASSTLGIRYNLVGKLGKRTKHQAKLVAQLALQVNVDEANTERIKNSEVDDSDVPQNVPLVDDVRLNAIQFNESDDKEDKLVISNIDQKLFITLVQEMLVAKPADGLEGEELQPFLEMILSQKNTYCVRMVALILRCRLETKNRRTVERCLGQSEEVTNSYKRENPPVLNRVMDVFGTGLPPIWKVEAEYAYLLLNIGLVKNSLDIYLKIQLWEEVIVCYTLLEMKHKAREVIQQQLEANPTVKMWCLLGDATDDVKCYERAWEMSKRRSHRAQRHWGNFHFSKSEYTECIPHFEKSLSINPLQATVWFRLGFAALKSENWQTAATAYRRYTTLEPDGFEAWNNLAQAYIKLDNKRSAHQAIKEALKCNYENWKVWENFLVISCDLANFAEVIRAYHRLLDLKDKYMNIEVISVLVYNVCIDYQGASHGKLLKPTRELVGRITTVFPTDGHVWELYSNLAPNPLVRVQRLQKAYRGYYMENTWSKNPQDCKKILDVCSKLGEVILTAVATKDVDINDPIVNSARLNMSAMVSWTKLHRWDEVTDLVETISKDLTQINAILESNKKSNV